MLWTKKLMRDHFRTPWIVSKFTESLCLWVYLMWCFLPFYTAVLLTTAVFSLLLRSAPWDSGRNTDYTEKESIACNLRCKRLPLPLPQGRRLKSFCKQELRSSATLNLWIYNRPWINGIGPELDTFLSFNRNLFTMYFWCAFILMKSNLINGAWMQSKPYLSIGTRQDNLVQLFNKHLSQHG